MVCDYLIYIVYIKIYKLHVITFVLVCSKKVICLYMSCLDLILKEYFSNIKREILNSFNSSHQQNLS